MYFTKEELKAIFKMSALLMLVNGKRTQDYQVFSSLFMLLMYKCDSFGYWKEIMANTSDTDLVMPIFEIATMPIQKKRLVCAFFAVISTMTYELRLDRFIIWRKLVILCQLPEDLTIPDAKQIFANM